MKRIPLIILTLLAAVWLVFAISQFVSTTSSIAATTTDKSMMNVTSSNAAVVLHSLENRTVSMQNIASTIESSGQEYNSPEVLGLLRRLSETEGYERLAIDFASGTTYTSDGLVFDISHMDYGDKIRAGKPFVMDVTPALADGTPLVGIFVPLKGPNGYEAALRCAVTTNTFSLLFQQTFYTAGASFVLADSKGQYVATSNTPPKAFEGGNYYEDLEKLSYLKGFSASLATAPAAKGTLRYQVEKEIYHAYFAPVGENGWQLAMVVPQEAVLGQSSAHIANAFFLLAQFVVLIMAFTLYIYLSERSAKRKALLNEACFKALSAQTGKVILEWDLENNKNITLANFSELFGREAATRDSAEDALNQSSVLAEDQAAFREVFSTILGGNPITDARFRVADKDGVYHWCSLSGIVVKKPNGKPYKAIGTLENIEEQVQKEESLRQKAETDALTGLYNRAATEYLIQETLKSRRSSDYRHALFIIDVDNFKAVNDKLGHMYGDSVLVSLSGMLKNLFRSDDIVGRVGGDEFFVFLKNYNNIHLVHTKASEICELYRNTYIENGQMVSISASVGISLCPEDGTDFEALYKNADTALYQAKAKGKDQFSLYQREKPSPPSA